MGKKYRLTIAGSYIGYVTQAIVNNFTPLLYVFFNDSFNISTAQISILVFVNFFIQIIVDTMSANIALKIGYRRSAIIAHALSGFGLILLCFLPYIINPFVGIIISVLFMASGGGFIEVIVSPMVEALPLDNKSGAMSFLHSFYCWGHIAVVVIASLFFLFYGIDNWRYLSIFFALVPLLNIIILVVCPIETLKGDTKPLKAKGIFTLKGFFIFFLVILAGGATEQIIAQWGSYYAEKILLTNSKIIGDIFGMSLFALSMAIARTGFGFIGDKIDLKKLILIFGMALSILYPIIALAPNPYIGLAGIALSGIFVSIIWPGIYSLAGSSFPQGGAKMFGILALGGDLGCTLGPALAGLVFSDLSTGILVSTIYPLTIVIGMLIILKKADN